MDIKQIQELVKMVTKAGIAELKIKEGDFAVTIKAVASGSAVVQMPMQSLHPSQIVTHTTAESNGSKEETATTIDNNLLTFKSPMIGTFYRKPGVDKDAFVKVGDSIENGTVLCIIEAMKLFNEIEFDGGNAKIVKILVDDSSPVEYDQPLFLYEKVG